MNEADRNRLKEFRKLRPEIGPSGQDLIVGIDGAKGTMRDDSHIHLGLPIGENYFLDLPLVGGLLKSSSLWNIQSR